MVDAFVVDIDWPMVLSGLLSLALALGGWFARAYFKWWERTIEELYAKTDRDKAEVIAMMVRFKAEVLELIKQSDKRTEEMFRAAAARDEKLDKKIDATAASLESKIDQYHDKTDKKIDATAGRLESKIDKTDKKIDQYHDKTDKKIDATAGRLESKIDKTDEKIDQNHDKTDKKIDQYHDKLDGRQEERHRETQTALRDLNYSVGRLEGAGGVQGGSGDRSGRPSLRRNSDPSPTPGGAPEPEQVAQRHDRPMVPLAGVLAEPATATGLARQAVPGEEQTGQQGDETAPEPHTEESPDTE